MAFRYKNGQAREGRDRSRPVPTETTQIEMTRRGGPPWPPVSEASDRHGGFGQPLWIVRYKNGAH